MTALPEPDLSRLHTRLVPRGDGDPPSAMPRPGSRGRTRAALFGGGVAGIATVSAAIGGTAIAETGGEALIVAIAIAGIVVGLGVCLAVATGIWAEAEGARVQARSSRRPKPPAAPPRAPC